MSEKTVSGGLGEGLKGLVAPSLWRIDRCTKHENYEPDCCLCNEEILTTKTEKAYRAGFKAALEAAAPPSTAPPKDFERAEGLYLKFSEPLMEPHTPVIIERVNGNCTVSQFIIARDEARHLIGQLKYLLEVQQ